MPRAKFVVRSVTVGGATYLRAEDVMAYLVDLAAGEEADTRRRVVEAAANLGRVGPNAVNTEGRGCSEKS